jgi:fermentation-respiration switch protein FrsA (DUF1100 family)
MRPSAAAVRRCVRAFAAAMFLLGTGACVLARPARSVVGRAPAALGARNVTFRSASGSVIHAWLAAGRPGSGAVLLLHGMGENRTAMLGRARFLHRAGFTVLAPDFQAHGESSGRHITFGQLESLDARAALAFLRSAVPGERIGVIGVSMGGAASLLGPTPLDADALVLESVYPTFRDAVSDRLHVWLGPLGFLGSAATPALIQLVAPRIGVDPDRLRPIDAITRVAEPLLMIAGTADRYTRVGETRALFARATSPKELWEVAGAGHEDLHDFAPAEYERRVGDFLARHLRGPASAAEALAGVASPQDSLTACVSSEAAGRRGCR